MLQLTAKQTEALKIVLSGKYTLVVFGGAVGGGKSIWLLSVFTILSSLFPYSRWVILRDSTPTLKRTILKTLEQYFLSDGLNYSITKYDQQTQTIYFKNGSEIMFMAENFDQDKELFRFRGLEVNGFGADEINELREETFNKMFERIGRWQPPRMKKVPKPIIVGTCNPSDNWLKKRVYTPYQNGTIAENWKFIVAKVTDNPHLSTEYLENLKLNMTPIDYQKYVEGDWNARISTNNFATYFSNAKHVSSCELDIKKRLFISIDFNLNPFALIASHIWYDSEGFHFHIVDELSIENGSIPAMIEKIKIKYYPWLPNMVITGDFNGTKKELSLIDNASAYEQIRRALRLSVSQIVTPSNPTHLDSRAECNYVFYFHPDFRVNPNCQQVIFDLENVEVDAFGAIEKKNRKDLKQRADFLDTVRYLINTHLRKWIEYNQKKPQ